MEDEFVQLGLSTLLYSVMNNHCFTKCFNIFTIYHPVHLCVDCYALALAFAGGSCFKLATWLILPVVIRSSQRLSHACLSINDSIL